MCVYFEVTQNYFLSQNIFLLNKCGIIVNGQRKERTDKTKRKEAKTFKKIRRKKRREFVIFLCAKHRRKKVIFTSEIMKNMNPQQLVNFLLPNDDWQIKDSTVNASGN